MPERFPDPVPRLGLAQKSSVHAARIYSVPGTVLGLSWTVVRKTEALPSRYSPEALEEMGRTVKHSINPSKSRQFLCLPISFFTPL